MFFANSVCLVLLLRSKDFTSVIIRLLFSSAGAEEELLCFLCESPVDVQLEPCKHAVLCDSCAQRAKKCPHCRVSPSTLVAE